MKTITLVLIAAICCMTFLIWSFLPTGQTFAQNPQLKLWSMPPYQIDFTTPTPTVISLPNGSGNLPESYTGLPSNYAHNMMYDDQGKLQFFMVDEVIYNASGEEFFDYSTSITGIHFNFVNGDSEHLIVPMRGDCNKYYIISIGANSQNRSSIFYFILDVSSPITIYDLQEINLLLDPKDPFVNLAVSTLNSDNSRYLYITHHWGIKKFIITGSGITLDNSWSFARLSGFDYRTEIELIKIPGGNFDNTYKLAVPSAICYDGPCYHVHSEIEIHTLNADGDPSSTTNVDFFDVTGYVCCASHGSGFHYQDVLIKGMEFSPDGNYLYFTTLRPPYLYFYDLTTGTVNKLEDFTNIGTSTPQPEDFADTQIEIAYDGHLYYAAQKRMAFLTDPNDPTSAWVDPAPLSQTVNIDKTYGLGLYQAHSSDYGIRILPDQIDGEDYDELKPHYTNTFTATTSATWTPSSNPFGNSAVVVINDLLTIPAGVSIVIEDMTFKFGEDAKVILERGSPGTKGAELTLNNTIFSSFDNCGEVELMWEGIQVWGYRTEPQLPLATTRQAYLRILNNSLVENADIGAIASGPDPNIFGNAGGIIQAENSTFRNNRIAAALVFYTGFTNLSYFKGCTFETTKSLNNPSLNPFAHISMGEVHGISIQGNTFRNTTTNLFHSTTAGERGIGIFSANASYSVKPLGGVPNTFQELNYGIQAFASNPLNTVFINNNEFIDNRGGISLNGVDYATITSNNIVVGPYTILPFDINDLPYGLYMSGCTAYQVEDNQFTALPTNDKFLVGSIVLNSGSLPNVIYRNIYENLYVSCLAEGNNRAAPPGEGPPGGGLQIKCNEFTNLRTTFSGAGWDIAVTYPFMSFPILGPGIAKFQGTCLDATTPSGNKFFYSACPNNDDANIFVNPNPSVEEIFYSHHTDLVAFPQSINCYTETGIPPKVTLNPCTSSITDACPPSPICINLIPNVHSCYIEIGDLENNAAELSVLIDGGNTQFLISKIKQGNPGHIRKAFMDASPYLSNAMLILAINSGLPPGILQQILIANSPLTDEVMDALNNIFVPNGVMNQINNVQTGISERTKLESEIAYYLSQRELIVSEIIRFYLNYSLPGAEDSVIAILKRENRPARREQLVAAFIKKKEFIKAEQEITHLHPNGNLDDFCKVQKVLIELGKQGKHIKQMNALQVQTVRAVAADTARKACAHAQAMLKAAFDENFREIIILPKQNQNKMGYSQVNKVNSEETLAPLDENHKLRCFPNPFSDYTTIEAFVPDGITSAHIVIFNLLGVKVKKYTVNQGYNAITILNEDLPDKGVYFYALYGYGRMLEQSKLVIIK